MSELRVVKSAPAPTPASSGDGGGGGKTTGERLATLEAEIKHLATKEDIKDIKIWVLGGVISAFIIASLVMWRLFPSDLPSSPAASISTPKAGTDIRTRD